MYSIVFWGLARIIGIETMRMFCLCYRILYPVRKKVYSENILFKIIKIVISFNDLLK